MHEHSITIPAEDHAAPLTLFFAIEAEWLDADESAGAGWEGQAELVAGRIGGLDLTAEQVLAYATPRDVRDRRQAELAALVWIRDRERAAWTWFSEATPSPAYEARQARAEEREDMREGMGW